SITQHDLVQPFQRFGYIQEVKFHADRGFAFVKMDTHENAANAIVHLQGMNINGNIAKLSWGKDRPPPGWQNYNGYPQQSNYNQGQYGRRQPNSNVFGVHQQLSSGYAFQNGN
ncbi:Nucleolysin TIAR, partial [Rhizopus azygosporus]